MTATAQAYRPLFSPGIALGRSQALGHIETVSSSRPTQASILGRRLIMPYSARASSTGIVGFSLLLMLAPALAALPISLPIDSASLSDLMAGRDVCGDADNIESCLRVANCAELDPLVACTASEPVWLPDLSQGGIGGREMLWRRVLPMPAGPHPNSGSLALSMGRLVGSSTFQQMPSAVALYDKSQVQKAHPEHCEARYCSVPAALYGVNEAGISFPSSKTKVRARRPPPSSLASAP